MRRMYCVQQWFGLSDEGLEETIDDSQAFRAFLGIDLGRESVPGATTRLKFRRLLEENDLARSIFDTVNRTLRERGL
jgi:IS5 family transposase